MSFAGHALDAINRIEYNRNLLKFHRATYSDLKKAVININAKYHKFRDKSKLTERELTQYKRKIKSKIIKDRQKAFLKSLVITIVIIGITIYVVKFLYNLFNSSF